MHDFITVKKLSDQQLQDLLQNIERKFGGTNNPSVYELLMEQKDVILAEIRERQMMDSYRNPPFPAMSLTIDELSEKERQQYETKDKKQKN